MKLNLSHAAEMASLSPVPISETGGAIFEIQIGFSLGHPDAYYPPNRFFEILYLFSIKMEKCPKT